MILELLTKELRKEIRKKHLISRISPEALFRLNQASKKKGISRSQLIEQWIKSIDLDDK